MPRPTADLPTRKQLFVDPETQGALVARAIIYWVACTLSIALLLLCWRVFTGPVRPFWFHLENLWFFQGPALVASVLVLPLAVIDVIRLSNRFAGPTVRLRRAMRALAAGHHVAPLEFRKTDFWYDFAEEFNAVAEEINTLRRLEASSLDPAEVDESSVAFAAGSHA